MFNPLCLNYIYNFVNFFISRLSFTTNFTFVFNFINPNTLIIVYHTAHFGLNNFKYLYY